MQTDGVFVCPLVMVLDDMGNEIRDLIPTDKSDIGAVERIIECGYPAIEPILPDLMEWMQDINWPVAQVLRPFLVSIGEPLAPYILTILKADDDLWKYWTIICIVAEAQSLTVALRAELERLALTPTQGERNELIDILAQNILRRLRDGTSESVLPEPYRTSS